ncbi:hypothetical protein [Streptosporangium sp. KLBMP 9127]|nr:hypothetical protein [Streptosporangium sp. KLBMP 9127]
MIDTGVAIDTSDRRFQILAGEYAEFAEGLRSRWGDAFPLPYEEFAHPYQELRSTLLNGCERLGEDLRHIGAGQVVMAGRNTNTEHANVRNVVRARP